MKARLHILVAPLSILSFAPAQAVTTWTYAPSAASDTGAKTIDEVTITPTYTWETTEGFGANLSSGMLQIGKKDYNATKIEYAFTAFTTAVRKVTFTGRTAAGNNGKVNFSAAVGSSAFVVSGVLTNDESSVVLTAPAAPQSGRLSLEVSNPRAHEANASSQAIYLKSILVELNETPVANWSSVEEVNATVNATTTLDLTSAFSDADGDSLSYSADVPTVSFSGHSLQFVPSQEGDTTIVVTTADPYGATASVTVLVHATTPSVPPPTLDVAVTSWTAGVAGTSAVSATLEGNVACTFERVTMSDGSSATVANGILSWTPPATNASSSVTATFHVTHGTDGWDLLQVLSVAATPAPSAPAIEFSNVRRRSFNASWTASAGGPVVEYKVRAWTGRATPDNETGGTNENFVAYHSNGTVPTGWYFENTRSYNYENAPVGFAEDGVWIATPDFGGTITAFSFQLSSVGTVANSHFYAYGTTGSTNQTDWIPLGEATENGALSSGSKSFAPDASLSISRLVFLYEKGGSGSVRFGTFNVSGKDWPAADFLEGWGGAKKSVGAATSQTISNPVAGTTNYVEVTAVGPTGLSTSAIKSINIPRASNAVISVK